MTDFKLTNFHPSEFVPRLIYEAMGDNCLLLMQTIILISAEDIRAFFGKPVTINNWRTGGQFEFRGFRPAYCTVGTEAGEHRLGSAFDCDIEGMTAEEVRQGIVNHPEKFPYITRLESGVNWVHADCKKTGLTKIQIFKV